MSLRIVLVLIALLSSAGAASGQSEDSLPVPLHGKIDGRVYVSPTGLFRMSIPVLPELGGTIVDTDNVVTFQDDFKVHVSVATFAQDATQRWENDTRGRRDYLVYFFSNYVLPDFQQRSAGAKIESARFLPDVQNGALIVYLLLPGGSMFADKVSLSGQPDPQLVAKRGNLLFVRNGHVFVISTELAERVLEHSTYHKTVAEEDEILRGRLFDLLNRMEFTKPAGPADKK